MTKIIQTSENIVSVNTGDVPEFQLELRATNCGVQLCLENCDIDNMQVYKDKYNQLIENPNGMLLYSIKTDDKTISKLKFMYDCGFKLDWEVSEYITDKAIILYDLEKDCTELMLGENRFTIVAK